MNGVVSVEKGARYCEVDEVWGCEDSHEPTVHAAAFWKGFEGPKDTLEDRRMAWAKMALYRCGECVTKSWPDLIAGGCANCSMPMAPTGPKSPVHKVTHYEEENHVYNAETLAKARDIWVKSNRKQGESQVDARARFWAENPGLEEEGVPSISEASETVGERVFKAIDRAARNWHLQGLHVDKPLVEVRNLVRASVPGLYGAEDSSEPAESIAKSVTDPEVVEFLAKWG
jgi:hypothetical protein